MCAAAFVLGLVAGLVAGLDAVFGAAFAVDLTPVLAAVLVVGFALEVLVTLAGVFTAGLVAVLAAGLVLVLGAVLVVPWAKPIATQPMRRTQMLILLRISELVNKVLSTLVPYFLRNFQTASIA